jgi:hypothetical protein
MLLFKPGEQIGHGVTRLDKGSNPPYGYRKGQRLFQDFQGVFPPGSFMKSKCLQNQDIDQVKGVV